MKIFKLAFFAALLAIALPTNAQSPYSSYGYGLLNDYSTSAQRAMGGIGYAMNSGRQINVKNPASYASIDSLTFLFDIGLDLTCLWSKENGKTGKDFGGGLDYITMQFPISKTLGGSFGLLPYSSVGYSFGSDIEHGASQREGSGGLNMLYAGLGWNVFKGFNMGFNASYLFGTTTNNLYAVTDGGSTTLFQRYVEVRDYHIQIGAQYSLNIGRKNRVTAGLTYSQGKTLLGNTYGLYYDTSADTEADTIGYTSLKNKYSLPDSWGAGLNYEWDKRLMVEVDFTYQPWSKAKYAIMDKLEQRSEFDDRWKIAAGLQYTPNPRGSYWQRIQYRCGGYYNHDYITIGDNNVHDYGVSMGFGLPTPSNKTMVNLGFEYKHRQATPNPLLKESYFNITLGVNFNEMWFWRNKIR